MKNYNYYREQLNRIQVNGEFSPTIKIVDGNLPGIHTNFIDLNKESATELVKWLNENFINK